MTDGKQDTELAEQEEPKEPENKNAEIIVVQDNGPMSNILDTAKFNHLWRVAQVFANSTIVPEHFQRNPSNCFIAVQMAVRCNVDPFMFLQNCHVVHGKPGIEAKLAIALLNASGRISRNVRYELNGEGPKRSCTATVIDAQSGEEVSHTLSMETAKAEGWIGKKGSKWVTDPDLMICYRSAMRLCRLHYPDVLLGMYTNEELGEIPEAKPSRQTTVSSMEDLTERLEQGMAKDDPSSVEESTSEPSQGEQDEIAEAKEQDELFNKNKSAVQE